MTDLTNRLQSMPDKEFYALLVFANRVQAWSVARDDQSGSFGDAASHFQVPVHRIADAVEAHYWMFTHDDHLPPAERHIEHEGE